MLRSSKCTGSVSELLADEVQLMMSKYMVRSASLEGKLRLWGHSVFQRKLFSLYQGSIASKIHFYFSEADSVFDEDIAVF